MVWQVQHHTAKTRNLDCHSRLFWWNIGTWIPGSSECWTFVWVPKQCPARMESVHPNNVTSFWFKDPDDWLFVLSPMDIGILALTRFFGRKAIQGIGTFSSLCGARVTPEWAWGSSMSLHHGLFTCSWVCTRGHNQIRQLAPSHLPQPATVQ